MDIRPYAYNAMTRLNAAELSFCRYVNRTFSNSTVRRFFRAVGWLGNGKIWYALLIALPIVYGRTGVVASLTMGVSSIIGIVLYLSLKHRFMRERPYTTGEIEAHGRPIDQFSFPSGHALHAVSFTIIGVSFFPVLGWFLIPLAALIAISRVVLGLHYPTDVLVGGILGAVLAEVLLAIVF